MESVFLKEIKNNNFSIEDNPLVSVVTTAYNIDPFIEKTIESVLMQKTNFKVEMVIGEDCSLDCTREIALNFEKKYPEIIHVLAHPKNLGITPNFITTVNACRGKYIALLDGDDYWTDSLKLQKQIDFLEHNKDYSGSTHQAVVIYESGDDSHLFCDVQKKTLGILDTVSNRLFHTSSLVFRKEIWDKVGGIPKDVLVSNDRAIYPLVAIFGKINYFNEPMCIYRKTKTGISSNATYKQLKTELFIIPWIKKIDPSFPYLRFKSFLHYSIYSNSREIKFLPLVKHSLLFLFYSFSYFPKNIGDVKYGLFEFLRRIRRK